MIEPSQLKFPAPGRAPKAQRWKGRYRVREPSRLEGAICMRIKLRAFNNGESANSEQRAGSFRCEIIIGSSEAAAAVQAEGSKEG